MTVRPSQTPEFLETEVFPRFPTLREAEEEMRRSGGAMRRGAQTIPVSEFSGAIVCLIYANDMYVERTLSEETVRRFLPGAKVWTTNEYQHSGLLDDGYRICHRILEMGTGGSLPP